MTKMAFVQLQVMSAYSLLKSTASIEKTVAAAKNRGYQSIALTDQNVLYGTVDFYKMCLKKGIKPLLGLTLEIAGILQKERNFSIVLLAKNANGYQNLMKLSSKKMLLDPQERMTITDLRDYSNDLIAITPGSNGETEFFLINEEPEQAEKILTEWSTVFPENHFYLGLQLHEDLKKIISSSQAIAEKIGIQTVAMNDVRYLDPEDDFSTKVIRAIDAGEQLSSDEYVSSGTYYLPESIEIFERFRDAGLEQAALRTAEIAEKIHIELDLQQELLPNYPLPDQTETTAYLRERCFEGLEERIPDHSSDSRYKERLNHELAVIQQMGFEDYFLIVWDVMAYAHRSGIVTGAGRGSAAGSLVSYVLAITDIDPIEYDLLFERFLNEERYTMPDIDLDFPDNRREEVLQYVKNKYGKNHVAQIATFGTLAAKMALRDVARVFGLSQSDANIWSKTIPKVLGISLEESYRQSKELKNLVHKSDRNELLFETAKKIEGLPRHVSTHAAGVVISDQPLDQLVPLQEGSGGIHLTQYAMGNVEEIGLLKMDFLGLKNLSIIDNTLKLIKREEHIQLDLLKIPMDDQAALTIFKRADTVGIFQFESAGIKNVLRKLGPTSIEDVAAVNALYRPGPMEQIDLFIKRKKGIEAIVYPHESLKDILGVTYGVMVYQEQVMQVASKMGGYTLGQADILRRAMSKKQKAVIDQEREHFVSGAIALGYPKEVAVQVYSYIERFANYGFNRSHAVAYSFIAYQMAYLKAHYPQAFFVALLNSSINNATKMKEYMLEAKKRKIVVLPPDINQSFSVFSLKNDQIQFGLGSIKGLRRDMIQEVIQERKTQGSFADLVDFLRRLDSKWQKEETVKPLIYAGAFDGFGHSRGTLVASLEGMLSSVKLSGNNVSLFDVLQPKYEPAPDLSLEERLETEEQYLGVYLSGHPSENYEHIRFLKSAAYIKDLQIGQSGKAVGLIKSIRKIQTKKGEPMAFAVISDSSGDCSLTLFPVKYRQYARLLEKGRMIYVEGKVEERREEEKQLIVNQIQDVKELSQSSSPDKCFIRIPSEHMHSAVLSKIEETLRQYSGNIPVILYYAESNKKVVLNETDWVDGSSELQKRLEELIGGGNIVIQKG